jgi:O-6-methylguanine DNA methyltransferase
MNATAAIPTPLGTMHASATERGICRLGFSSAGKSAAPAASPAARRHLEKLRGELERYFAGKLRKFTVRLDVAGTQFRQLVWRELQRIPFGETISYAELAARIGSPRATRAVGGANGANEICIVIPCHRVIAADGSLGGYSAGLSRKQRLLVLERDGVLP